MSDYVRQTGVTLKDLYSTERIFFLLNIIVSLAPDCAGLCKTVSLEKKKTARN